MSISENQTFRPIAVIRIDGQSATWVDPNPVGLYCPPEHFVQTTGITIEQLKNYAETGEEFILFEDEPPYTAGFEKYDPSEEEDGAGSSKGDDYWVYEFTSLNGGEGFCVAHSGDENIVSPKQFTEKTGIAFIEVQRRDGSGEPLEIPCFNDSFEVESFLVSREPGERDEVLADLHDNLVRLRKLDKDDREHVLTALNRHLGNLSEFLAA